MASNLDFREVPPHALETALDHVRQGGRLIVPTYTRCYVIDAKCLARFEKLNQWVLKEEGDGYRMRTGRTSVYLMPGHLKYA
jgi:NDP-sugar pyrophosphorylase family protein